MIASEVEMDPEWMKVDRRGSRSRNGSASSSGSLEWGPTAPASHINTGDLNLHNNMLSRGCVKVVRVVRGSKSYMLCKDKEIWV